MPLLFTVVVPKAVVEGESSAEREGCVEEDTALLTLAEEEGEGAPVPAPLPVGGAVAVSAAEPTVEVEAVEESVAAELPVEPGEGVGSAEGENCEEGVAPELPLPAAEAVAGAVAAAEALAPPVGEPGEDSEGVEVTD